MWHPYEMMPAGSTVHGFNVIELIRNQNSRCAFLDIIMAFHNLFTSVIHRLVQYMALLLGKAISLIAKLRAIAFGHQAGNLNCLS